MALWRDRRGRLSALKVATLLMVLSPAFVLGVAAALEELGAEPVERLQDEAGAWALRFLFLSLLVTPLRLLWRWNALIQVRRMVGLAALGYVAAHCVFYAALEDWAWVSIGNEIATRVYLAIGAVAVTGLAVLGLTSTDGAVRRLGVDRWQALHSATYVIAILATAHVFIQTRLDPTMAFVMSGLLLWLLAIRLWRRVSGAMDLNASLAVTILAAAATALGEALLFHLRFGVDVATLLGVNLSPAAGWRPAWLVLGLGLAITLVAAVRRAQKTGRRKGASAPERRVAPEPGAALSLPRRI